MVNMLGRATHDTAVPSAAKLAHSTAAGSFVIEQQAVRGADDLRPPRGKGGPSIVLMKTAVLEFACCAQAVPLRVAKYGYSGGRPARTHQHGSFRSHRSQPGGTDYANV